MSALGLYGVPGGRRPWKIRRSSRCPTPGKPWTRDWTAWTLVLAPPALILGIGLVANSVSIGIGDAVIDLAFLGILVALTVKLICWLRRRSGC